MIRFPTLWIGVLLILAIRSTNAQSIQLPSIRTFSYSGSVMVPDSGTGFIGGNSSFATGQNQRGGLGVAGAAAGASVTATIIDLDEMDRQIRGIDSLAPPQTTDSARKPVDPIEQAKAVVRSARRAHSAGDHALSTAAYRLAIGQFDAIADFARRASKHRKVEPGGIVETRGIVATSGIVDARELAGLARAEFWRVYPDERIASARRP